MLTEISQLYTHIQKTDIVQFYIYKVSKTVKLTGKKGRMGLKENIDS